MIHRACALVPVCRSRVAMGVLTPLELPRMLNEPAVAVSSGQHTSEKDVAWARAVLGYSCARWLLQRGLHGTNTWIVKM